MVEYTEQLLLRVKGQSHVRDLKKSIFFFLMFKTFKKMFKKKKKNPQNIYISKGSLWEF